MPHSVTTTATNQPVFHVHRYSWPADSIEAMAEAVDELKVMLEDAEVILSNLRDRQLGVMDTTEDDLDLLDRIHEQEQAGADLSEEERRFLGYYDEPDGPPDLDFRDPPPNWEP